MFSMIYSVNAWPAIESSRLSPPAGCESHWQRRGARTATAEVSHTLLRLVQLELRLRKRLGAPEEQQRAIGKHLFALLAHIPYRTTVITPAIIHIVAQHASQAPPPTRREATTPYTHPSTPICLLAMSTRICCHRQRNHACTAHRPDDTRCTANLALPSHPTAFLQAS